MYNIAVVDDEKTFRDNIKDYLNQAQSIENLPPFKCYFFDNAYDYIESNIYFDLVFLDIQMPSLNGYEAAKKIRERGDTSIIVFLTFLAQYAIKGYEVEAFDYILKPIKYNEFLYRFKKALSKLKVDDDNSLFIKYKGKHMSIKISNITYIESMNHIVIIHTLDGSFEARESLIKIEERLKSSNFERCNYSCLVNLLNVIKVDGDEIYLKGSTSLFFSRNRKKQFLERYSEINKLC